MNLELRTFSSTLSDHAHLGANRTVALWTPGQPEKAYEGWTTHKDQSPALTRCTQAHFISLDSDWRRHAMVPHAGSMRTWVPRWVGGKNILHRVQFWQPTKKWWESRNLEKCKNSLWQWYKYSGKIHTFTDKRAVALTTVDFKKHCHWCVIKKLHTTSAWLVQYKGQKWLSEDTHSTHMDYINSPSNKQTWLDISSLICFSDMKPIPVCSYRHLLVFSLPRLNVNSMWILMPQYMWVQDKRVTPSSLPPSSSSIVLYETSFPVVIWFISFPATSSRDSATIYTMHSDH